MSKIVIGAQWGDEGKGKVVDVLSEDVEAVVRFQGGTNAGHTLVIDGVKVVLHNLSAGIMREGMLNLTGPLVLHDFDVLPAELQIAREHGARVILDASAPIALPIHKLLDKCREEAAGDRKIGTTQKGIGPGFEDFWSRRCVRLGDLRSEDGVRDVLTRSGYYAEKEAICRHYGAEPMSLDDAVAWLMSFAPQIVPYVGDARAILAKLTAENRNVLYEGAQGILLDRVHGSHPDVTASYCTAAAVMASLGVYPKNLKVVGVAKVYSTRVGSGPYPTEQDNENGEVMRDRGGEYGATTGRPRRCGWLDLVALRYACRVGGITHLVLTKADVLSGHDFEVVPVCTDYWLDNGTYVNEYDSLTAEVFAHARPVYEELNGWQDVSACRHRQNLPENLVNYIKYVEYFVGVPVMGISVGKDREEMVWL